MPVMQVLVTVPLFRLFFCFLSFNLSISLFVHRHYLQVREWNVFNLLNANGANEQLASGIVKLKI
jgi:hypothetical protein